MEFDVATGLLAKQQGLSLAATNRKELLITARAIATAVALEKGTVTSDDVYRVMGSEALDLGPAAGAVFKAANFEFTGQWEKSSRTSNHLRFNRVWKLRAQVN